jgi:hypothetical protein
VSSCRFRPIVPNSNEGANYIHGLGLNKGCNVTSPQQFFLRRVTFRHYPRNKYMRDRFRRT